MGRENLWFDFTKLKTDSDHESSNNNPILRKAIFFSRAGFTEIFNAICRNFPSEFSYARVATCTCKEAAILVRFGRDISVISLAFPNM